MSDKIPEREVGETVIIKASITQSGTSTDPDNVTITVRKPDGTIDEDGTGMTKTSTGEYEYAYNIPEVLGEYRYKITAEGSNNRRTIETGKWRAVRSI